MLRTTSERLINLNNIRKTSAFAPALKMVGTAAKLLGKGTVKAAKTVGLGGALNLGFYGLPAYQDAMDKTGDRTYALTRGLGATAAGAAAWGLGTAGINKATGLLGKAPGVFGKAGQFLSRHDTMVPLAAMMAPPVVNTITSLEQNYMAPITSGILGTGADILHPGRQLGDSLQAVRQHTIRRQNEMAEQEGYAQEGASTFFSKLGDMQMVQGVRNSIPVIDNGTIQDRMAQIQKQMELEQMYRNPNLLNMNPIM